MKNAFWLAASYGITRILKLGVAVLAARILGPAGYGSFSYCLSFAGAFFIFADLGLGTLVVREYHTRTVRPALLSTARSMKIASATVFGILACVGYLFSRLSGPLFGFVVLLLVVSHIRDFFASILRGMQRMEYEFVANVMESAAVLIGAYFFLYSHPSPEALAAMYLAGAAVSLCASFAFARGAFRPASFSSHEGAWLLKNGFPMALFGLTSFLFFSADQIIIGIFGEAADVGRYAVAARIVASAALIPAFLSSAIFPALSERSGDPAFRRRIFSRMMLILSSGGVLVAVLLSLFAGYLIPALFGPGYEPSVGVFRLLVWMLVFVFPGSFLDYFLFARNRQSADFIATLGAGILNVILGFMLVPAYGMHGAAIASIVAQAANFTVTFSYARTVL